MAQGEIVHDIVDHEPVVLVDRTGQGDVEFQFGGRVYQFKPGESEKMVVKTVADHILGRGANRSEKGMVYTVEGDWVCRFALKGEPEAEEPIELHPVQGHEEHNPNNKLITIRVERQHFQELQGGGRGGVMAGVGR